MAQSLNAALITVIITILFISGRVIYLRKVQKQSSENKRTFIAVVKNDVLLRVVTSVGITLVILDLIRFYFTESYVSGLFIGLLFIVALSTIYIKAKRDEKFRETIINDWGKTHIGIKLYLIFLGLFVVYTFYNSVRDLFIS